jgi:hypothetical protein
LKVTYTEEAVADIVQSITYLNERNSTAAAKLGAALHRTVWPTGSLRGQSHGFAPVLSCGVGACRRFGSTTSGMPKNC